MNRNAKMTFGYITGGLLVIGLIPSAIYYITSLLDKVCRIEIFQHSLIKWTVVLPLFVAGILYGIWSVLIQNLVGKGGPVEIGNIEISPKTQHLVVSGPYKNTRNPMLFGTFLIYLAFALFLNSLSALILVVAFVVFMLTVVVKLEEKRLLKDFGSPYQSYQKRVSKFFPWFQRNAGAIDKLHEPENPKISE